MRKYISIAAAMLLCLGFCGTAAVAQQANVLTTLNFDIVGVGVEASPEYQAVPKGIASVVNTSYVANGSAAPADLVSLLPKDYRVMADLSGPSITGVLTLSTPPGQPFLLPSLPLLGKHTLSNIRVADGAGNLLFSAAPQAVSIESITDPLVTSVITRQLSLQEIRDRGVTIDSANFTAYEFTAALATTSGTVPFSFPVLVPSSTAAVEVNQVPPVNINDLPSESFSNLPPNTEVVPFILEVPPSGPDDKGANAAVLAGVSIPGVVVIPGNIGFLNQFFSALLIVTNGAPAQSELVVRDLQAKIILPPGADLTCDMENVLGIMLYWKRTGMSFYTVS